MQSIENLKITIAERSNAVCNILKSEFRDCPNVTIWQGDVRRFFAEHKDENGRHKDYDVICHGG